MTLLWHALRPIEYAIRTAMNKVLVSTDHSHCSYHIYQPNQSDCPLILLHGTNSDGLTSYSSLLDAFDHREIIVPDYAGCGDSSLPEHELTVSALADQVIAIINERGSKKVDLVGHSLGATVAAYVAAQHPDFVNRLVLSAPWCHGDDPRHQLVFNTWQTLEETAPQQATAFGLSHVLSPTFLANMDPELIARICATKGLPDTHRRIALGKDLDIRHYLSKIQAPTLVLAMAFDTLVPPYRAQEVQAALSNSEYDEIPSGHAVQLESPYPWANRINTFLQV